MTRRIDMWRRAIPFVPLMALLLLTTVSGVVVRASGHAPGSPAPSGQAAQVAPNPIDYSTDAAWLCRPGRQDACAIDHTTTIVAADGTQTRESWQADPKAPIDCFYVYPTISTDPGEHSDMTPDPAELNVVAQQFARLASVCRPFAPLYRQVTLAGLRKRLAEGGPTSLGTGLGYDDVRDAWKHYLGRDNNGRGVVLVGHSQGSYILIELIKQEIDGTPVQGRLVSAILMGTTVTVPEGKDMGGTFTSVPACRRASQTGCVISFSTYRSTIPPPPNARFGRETGPGEHALCTNPATFSDASGPLHAYLSASGRTITGTTPPAAWAAGATIDTPWVSVPGLLTARCTSNEHATYLEVTVNADAADPRTDDIVGDIGPRGRPAADWGLHLVDANLAMGDLVRIVGEQGRSWGAARRP